MSALPPSLMITAATTIAAIAALGLASGKHVKSAADFDTGGSSAGPLLVAGTLVGTLVGGSSTIGTAQLAFAYGLSAWWFTLGAALGCAVLGLGLSRRLRASGAGTIQEIIGREYGGASRVVTSVLASAGIVINIVAQVLSANALLGTLFGLSSGASAALSVALMTAFVLAGGIRGAGVVGLVKLGLLYVMALACGALALYRAGGPSAIAAALPRERYLSLVARGAGLDLGAGLSVALGVLSTQTYVQAVLVARSDRAARRGSILAAVLTPPVGLLCIVVGYYMRMSRPDLPAGQALPRFIVDNLPPALGGVCLATLLIAVVGTGSGMALGFARIVVNDLYLRYVRPTADGKRQLLVSRLVIAGVLAASALGAEGSAGSLILRFGFLSMGLRAAVLLVPMLSALFLPGRLRGRYAIASSAAGLTAMVAGEWVGLPFDSLFLGLGLGAMAACAGLIAGPRGTGRFRA